MTSHVQQTLPFPWQGGCQCNLQLLIQPWICGPGTHYVWVGQGSVEYDVCLTLLHMASTGNRTTDPIHWTTCSHIYIYIYKCLNLIRHHVSFRPAHVHFLLYFFTCAIYACVSCLIGNLVYRHLWTTCCAPLYFWIHTRTRNQTWVACAESQLLYLSNSFKWVVYCLYSHASGHRYKPS